jgi:signal transduction histidine kinase
MSTPEPLVETAIVSAIPPEKLLPEGWFREVCDSLPEAFLILNLQLQVLYLNRSAEALLGGDRQEWLGCCLLERLPSFADSIFVQECARSLVQQREIHFEQFDAEKGMILDLRVRPHPAGLALSLQDATAKQQAEVLRCEQIRLTTLTAAVSHRLGQGGTLTELLEHCTWAMVESLEEIALVRIWTLDTENHWLELQAIAGSVNHTQDFPARIPLGISLIGLLAQNQQTYLSNDALHDICLGATTWLQQEQLVAFAGYPLVVEARTVGVMALFSRQPISDLTYHMLQWVAKSIAIAIDRTLAREELLNRREKLLLRLTNQIRNSLDLDQILTATVQEVRQLMQIDRCHFLWCWSNIDPALPQTELRPIIYITHEAKDAKLPSLLGECPPEQSLKLAQQIFDSQQNQSAMIANAGSSDLPEGENPMDYWGMRSHLLLPLETHSGQLGAIVCGHCQEPRIWTETEVELLQAVVNQLALAIDQAELYARTRAAALAAQTQTQQLSQALENLRQTQAQLIQSEKMSSLGQLVAGIAHEINNPVTFISGNLSYASTYFQDLLNLLNLYQRHYPEPVPGIRDYIEDIDLDFLMIDFSRLLESMQMGADRINKIVLSLRSFSHLDEAAVKTIDLHRGIENTLIMLENRLKASETTPYIDVVKHYCQLPRIHCYASQLNQVFMNILSNAIDAVQACPHPTITISTELRHEAERFALEPSHYPSSDWVRIRIRDNGIGMTEAVRQKIFDPFFTTKPIGQGTGLGLSISHQIIVQKHRGNLSCTSTPQEGTEFVIELPLRSAHLPS